MKYFIYLFLVSVLFSFSISGQNSIGLINGRVFDGQKFVKKDLFIIDGKITFIKPAELGKIVDISNRFVIPPFGDAHTHNLDRKWQLPSISEQYLKEGTFYVQNLTSKTRNIGVFKKYFNTKDTLDIRFSHQGLTSTLGHPFLAYEPFAMGLNDASKWKENMGKILKSRIDENNSYIFIDTVEQAKEKLEGFFAQKPDIVKIYLTHVEDYVENSSNNKAGDSGLSPSVANYIVEQAKKKGLRVYAHIDTAKDFEVGVNIGVFGFAHIPIWKGKPGDINRYEVSDRLLKKAISKDIVIIPTINISIRTYRDKKESGTHQKQINQFRNFLLRYKKFGGKILIGSDIFGNTLTPELKDFIAIGIFNELELLKLVSEQTPRAIFPERKIGYLKEGFEGSILVLNANPLKTSQNLFQIKHRVKQGKFVD